MEKYGVYNLLYSLNSYECITLVPCFIMNINKSINTIINQFNFD